MGLSGRIARFFLTSQLTPLIALIAALLGLFAILITPREEEPQINVTMANVFIPFPGASAKDVETLVATPAEQVLSQIAGIEHIYSVSKPGMAVLTVQYLVGQDRTQALVRLYDTIQANRDWVSPELGVGEPIIKPLGIDDVPIVTVTLWTRDETRGAYELEQVAHAAEIELKRIAGTREVSTIGGPGRAVRVMMDPDRMAAFGVSAQDIRNALQVSNAAQPSGTLVSNNQEILVQTGTFLAGAEDVRQLVVGVTQGRPVYMNDVTTVVAGPDQPAQYVWHSPGAGGATSSGYGKADNGQIYPAVTLAISKKPGENAVDVAEKVIARVNALHNSVLPEGIETSITRNYGATADDKAKKLIQKLIFATASVVLLVLFAIGKREALIVGAAVLLTLAATLFASWAWGFTLNR
ncbi:MAG: efflux RND transporter permease subunit, partial [Thiobacillus sp.]|nr:efflux RND transporter permease subunit [Thiobacillus sp.]